MPSAAGVFFVCASGGTRLAPTAPFLPCLTISDPSTTTTHLVLLRCQENRGGSKPAAAASSLPRGRRGSVASVTVANPKAPAAADAALPTGANRRRSQLVSESDVASLSLSSSSSALPLPDFEGTEEDMVRSKLC